MTHAVAGNQYWQNSFNRLFRASLIFLQLWKIDMFICISNDMVSPSPLRIINEVSGVAKRKSDAQWPVVKTLPGETMNLLLIPFILQYSFIILQKTIGSWQFWLKPFVMLSSTVRLLVRSQPWFINSLPLHRVRITELHTQITDAAIWSLPRQRRNQCRFSIVDARPLSAYLRLSKVRTRPHSWISWNRSYDYSALETERLLMLTDFAGFTRKQAMIATKCQLDFLKLSRFLNWIGASFSYSDSDLDCQNLGLGLPYTMSIIYIAYISCKLVYLPFTLTQ